MNEFEQAWMRMMAFFDENPISYVVLIGTYALLWLRQRKKKLALQAQGLDAADQSYDTAKSHQPASKPQGGLLDRPLFNWSPRDPFTITDLLRGLIIIGGPGSGKTSGSGHIIGKALAACRMIGGLILASKPEDREFWQGIFQRAGRLKDLLIFGPSSPLRCNFIGFILQSGGDTRDVTHAIMNIGEIVQKNSGGTKSEEAFWRREKERMIYNAVEIVAMATADAQAPDLQEFINSAALSPDKLGSPEFKKTFHYKCLKLAHDHVRTAIERNDFDLAFKYWKDEYPAMADKMRSSTLAEVMGTLHVFNSGLVRELVSTTTNVSPAALDHGKWLFIDAPISSFGATGAFLLGGWKHISQWHLLRRKAQEDTPVAVIWADEYQKVANGNGGDASFLAESRSHRATVVALTQSIHSLYSRIREGGEHETDSLLTCFYTKIAHAVGDAKTAQYFGSLIGRRLVTRVNTSTSPGDGNVYDALFGTRKVSASTSQSIENVLENTEFMQNLRTGGRANGYMVDGIVVRSAQPFSNGEAYLKCSFSQK